MLVSTLARCREKTIRLVQDLTIQQLDYLWDENANTMGALLLHLAGLEVCYQELSFKGANIEHDPALIGKWGVPLALGEPARQQIRGYPIDYYLCELHAVREGTLQQLRHYIDNKCGETMTNQFDLAQQGQPQLTITPNPAFVDQPVQIRLTGFAPHQRVTLQAQMADSANQSWQSAAIFITDAAGVIDVDAQPPVAGSYAEVDGMGLFWSMCLLDEGQEAASFINRELAPLTMHFTALVGEQAVAAATLQRLLLAPGITRTPVREQGLVGTLFQPAGAGSFLGVLIVGGSEGELSFSEARAALLARHGYAALALAYFALEQLPAMLINIPLEYFATAITWLQQQPGVRPEQLAVIGGSRGGELALLLGATFPQINAVVAYAPSNVLWDGVDSNPANGPKPAWTYAGEPLPAMPEVDLALEEAIYVQEVAVLTPLFLPRLADPALVERAAIAVEKIKGPVLLIAGQDDQMWPADLMAAQVMQRLTHHRHPYPDQHLSYADVGHSIGLPYLPTTVTQSRHPIIGKVYAMGGKAQAYAAARADSWARVLAFLGEHLAA